MGNQWLQTLGFLVAMRLTDSLPMSSPMVLPSVPVNIRSTVKVALPSGLQSLTSGSEFNQNMVKVALPSGMPSLTLGSDFIQSMEKVALPCGLQSLTFGSEFSQSTEH